MLAGGFMHCTLGLFHFIELIGYLSFIHLTNTQYASLIHYELIVG